MELQKDLSQLLAFLILVGKAMPNQTQGKELITKIKKLLEDKESMSKFAESFSKLPVKLNQKKSKKIVTKKVGAPCGDGEPSAKTGCVREDGTVSPEYQSGSTNSPVSTQSSQGTPVVPVGPSKLRADREAQAQAVGNDQTVTPIVPTNPAQLQQDQKLQNAHSVETTTEQKVEPKKNPSEVVEKRKRTWWDYFFGPKSKEEKIDNSKHVENLKKERSSLSKVLASKKTVNQKQLKDDKNVNAVYFQYKDDGSRVVYKPELEESRAPSYSWMHGSETEREVATYKLAELLDLTDLVPVTDWAKDTEGNVREFTDNDGYVRAFTDRASVQEFVEGKKGVDWGNGDFNAIYSLDKNVVQKVALFDLLTGNNDRHWANWIVDDKNHPHLIDNGRSFPDVDNHRHYVERGWYRPIVNFPVPEYVRDWHSKQDQIDQTLKEQGISDLARKGVRKRLNALNEQVGKSMGSIEWDVDKVLADGVKTVHFGAFYGRGKWKGGDIMSSEFKPNR